MKTFLSIGSGPGMGYATAARFAREGFQIVLSARNSTNTRELADRLKATGYRAEVRTVNSADPDGVAAGVKELLDRISLQELDHLLDEQDAQSPPSGRIESVELARHRRLRRVKPKEIPL